MRRLRALCLLLMLGVAAAPAATAQIVGRPTYERVSVPDPFLGNGDRPGPSVGQELRAIDRRIDRARESGMITRREARAMRREAAGIARLAGFYRQGGFTPSERLELRTRIEVLRDSVNRHRRESPGGQSGH